MKNFVKHLNDSKIFFLALLVLFSATVFAAEDSTRVDLSQLTKVDINHADARTLAQHLDGVGIMKAEEIINYRETFGDFQSVEQLGDVKGIGEATIEKNRDRIVIILEANQASLP
ncbi:MAG: competence protein ComEA [SAR86 cluster bacterium]|uniref:Competence protein ComEA n=1 Tax=SAR86 cluster bacterium TaxID=2030880 RepID=A0A2A4MTI9_9GAMM|nr:MAG: competence protein ComEA [SAR86 cluster bacterium]